MLSIRSTFLAAGIVFGVAVTAQAQSGPNIANLPPAGPKASSQGFQGGGEPPRVAQSPAYPGPNAGAGNAPLAPHYAKPGDWDANTAMHPYTSKQGPSPN